MVFSRCLADVNSWVDEAGFLLFLWFICQFGSIRQTTPLDIVRNGRSILIIFRFIRLSHFPSCEPTKVISVLFSPSGEETAGAVPSFSRVSFKLLHKQPPMLSSAGDFPATDSCCKVGKPPPSLPI